MSSCAGSDHSSDDSLSDGEIRSSSDDDVDNAPKPLPLIPEHLLPEREQSPDHEMLPKGDTVSSPAHGDPEVFLDVIQGPIDEQQAAASKDLDPNEASLIGSASSASETPPVLAEDTSEPPHSQHQPDENNDQKCTTVSTTQESNRELDDVHEPESEVDIDLDVDEEESFSLSSSSSSAGSSSSSSCSSDCSTCADSPVDDRAAVQASVDPVLPAQGDGFGLGQILKESKCEAEPPVDANLSEPKNRYSKDTRVVAHSSKSSTSSRMVQIVKKSDRSKFFDDRRDDTDGELHRSGSKRRQAATTFQHKTTRMATSRPAGDGGSNRPQRSKTHGDSHGGCRRSRSRSRRKYSRSRDRAKRRRRGTATRSKVDDDNHRHHRDRRWSKRRHRSRHRRDESPKQLKSRGVQCDYGTFSEYRPPYVPVPPPIPVYYASAAAVWPPYQHHHY